MAYVVPDLAFAGVRTRPGGSFERLEFVLEQREAVRHVREPVQHEEQEDCDNTASLVRFTVHHSAFTSRRDATYSCSHTGRRSSPPCRS